MRRQTRAHHFAARKHKGKKDDDGKRYFETHIWKVAMAIRRLTDDDDVICAAFLHDTLEDTNTTYEELKIEFGKRVADLVNEVTHEGKADEYGFYFPRLKSPEAIMIKLVDRASNISRMDSWSEDRREHYIGKTKFWKDGQ